MIWILTIWFSGILIADLFLSSTVIPMIKWWILGLLFFYLPINFFSKQHSIFRVIRSFLLAIFLLLTAGWMSVSRKPSQKTNFIGKLPCSRFNFSGTIFQCKQTSFGFRYAVSIDQVGSQSVCGNVVLYSDKKGYPGQKILFNGSLELLSENSNPFCFNPKTHFERLNITHQVNKPGRIQIDPESGNILTLALKTRDFLNRKLTTTLINPVHIGIIKAILFGDDSEIPAESQDVFKSTGTVHVLAVSGMHVGILFSLISRMHRKHANGTPNKIFLVFSLIFLWFYGMMSGLAPSILRSVWVFSLGQIGEVLGRKKNPLNLLGAGALMILLFDPTSIYNIGFQLSFSAVLGILLWSEFLQTKFISKWKWLNSLIENIAVSISAQASTSLITLGYFGQFPIWFLPANLIAIPISSFLLLYTLGLCFLCWLPNNLLHYLMYPLKWSIDFMVKSMDYIANLPFQFDQRHFSRIELLAIGLIMVSIIQILKTKRRVYFYIGLTGICLFGMESNRKSNQRKSSNQLIVFNLKQGIAVGQIHSKRAELLCDSMAFKQAEKQLVPFYLNNGFKKSEIHIQLMKPNIYKFKHQNYNLYVAYKSPQKQLLNSNDWYISFKSKVKGGIRIVRSWNTNWKNNHSSRIFSLQKNGYLLFKSQS